MAVLINSTLVLVIEHSITLITSWKQQEKEVLKCTELYNIRENCTFQNQKGYFLKNSLRSAEKMAQQFRVHAALPDHRALFPAPTCIGSQLIVTPVPCYLHTSLQTCTQKHLFTHRYMYKQIKIKESFKKLDYAYSTLEIS